MGWKQENNFVYVQCFGDSFTGSNGGTIKTLQCYQNPQLEVLLLPPHIVLKCLQVEFALDPQTN